MTTMSVRFSTGALGSVRSGTVGRCCCRRRPSGYWRDRLPDGVTLRDLGVHRLRDLGRPEHVWQLVHPDLPAGFGALRSLEAYRHNLPVQLTPLVVASGRSPNFAPVFRGPAGDADWLRRGGEDPSGAGGRRELVDRFADGVWLVDLAPPADPATGRRRWRRSACASARASPLPAARGDSAPPAFAARPGQLRAPDRRVRRSWPSCCAPRVACGAGDQPGAARRPRRGHLAGAVAGVPPPESAVPVADAVAVRRGGLFVDRARRARPSFAVTADNAAAVAQSVTAWTASRWPSSWPPPAAASIGASDRRRAGRPLPVADRRSTHGDAAPADAPRRRLELRAAR